MQIQTYRFDSDTANLVNGILKIVRAEDQAAAGAGRMVKKGKEAKSTFRGLGEDGVRDLKRMALGWVSVTAAIGGAKRIYTAFVQAQQASVTTQRDFARSFIELVGLTDQTPAQARKQVEAFARASMRPEMAEAAGAMVMGRSQLPGVSDERFQRIMTGVAGLAQTSPETPLDELVKLMAQFVRSNEGISPEKIANQLKILSNLGDFPLKEMAGPAPRLTEFQKLTGASLPFTTAIGIIASRSAVAMENAMTGILRAAKEFREMKFDVGDVQRGKKATEKQLLRKKLGITEDTTIEQFFRSFAQAKLSEREMGQLFGMRSQKIGVEIRNDPAFFFKTLALTQAQLRGSADLIGENIKKLESDTFTSSYRERESLNVERGIRQVEDRQARETNLVIRRFEDAMERRFGQGLGGMIGGAGGMAVQTADIVNNVISNPLYDLITSVGELVGILKSNETQKRRGRK